jgi:hypothetical protein
VKVSLGIRRGRVRRTYGQSPERRPTQLAVLRPESYRLEDVGPRSNSPIDVHLQSPIRRLDTFWQSVNGRRHAIQLPSAVVAHDDPVTAHLDGLQRVLGRQHPLDPDLHLGLALEPGNVARPVLAVVQRVLAQGIVALRPQPFGGPADVWEALVAGDAEVVFPLPVSQAERGRVACEEDGLAALRFGLLDEGRCHSAVLEGVHLHREGHGRLNRRAGVADVLDRGAGQAGDDHVDASPRAGPRRGDLGVRVGHKLDRRANAHGKGDLSVQALDGRAAPGHVDQHARPDSVFPELRWSSPAS